MEHYASTGHHASNRSAEDDHVDMDFDDGEQTVDSTMGHKILRPRNAWILYRKTRLNDVAPLPDGSRQPMAKASSIISMWWRNESAEVRKKFEMLAALEKAEHKRRYPDYKYKPRTTEQIAKAKEKKKETKKIMHAREKEKKAKAREQVPAPPMVSSSSVHTSYIEAALANQAAMQAIQHGPDRLSPPLSHASTPITTPSPLPLSEVEQGSSSATATSSRAMSSPVDAAGLAQALPSFNFQGQQTTLRAPRHVPARIPPRRRTSGRLSVATTHSRVPSSSVLSPSIASPAASTPGEHSPGTWCLPPPTPQVDTPDSADESMGADLIRQTGQAAWGDDSTENSGTVAIDLEFGSLTHDVFSDISYFNSVGLPGMDVDGVFHMPPDPFLDAIPAQIDVTLPYCDPSDQDRDRFKALLSEFDFSQFQEELEEDSALLRTAPAADAWDQWSSGIEESVSFAHTGSHAATPAGHTGEAHVYQMSTPPLETEELAPHSAQVQDPHATSTTEVQQAIPSFSIPADIVADPDFQALWVKYMEQKQSQVQQSQPQLHQLHSNISPEVRAMQYDASLYDCQQPVFPEHILPSPTATSPSEPSTPASATVPPIANRYVPPAGAMRSGGRRVAGSWRPPCGQ